ncbi:ovarian-specific serine/threonine-protein kinase Lok isoform X2 [Prorops nasuta]|uniref:ovarian-specific serine/threonine-protein kinase Lok isoform X2 n=1 Tax=Prorops nasuta TaxID=863751 RepID=UPI0034CD9932
MPKQFDLKDYGCFYFSEMIKDEYTMGRSDSCDICFTKDNIKPKWLGVISKVHCKIIKERIINGNNDDIVVYLEDTSQNGTFVNKVLVGKGKRILLESNDIISLAQPVFAVYVFMSTKAFEGNDLPPELRCKYAVSRKLGSGACGEVKMVFSKIGCKRFAMKSIVKRTFSSGPRNLLNDPEKIMNEVKILKTLKHPCIIKMEEIVDTPRTVYIVLELMEGGELFDRIKGTNGLPEPITKIFFYQMVLAVRYLHERGITHRDLKPENILLADNAEVTLIKISDFGLSKLVDAETMMKTFCGTPLYVAPEILKTHGRGAYTSQVDIWSLGIILYACLSSAMPFSINDQNKGLQEQILSGRFCFPHSKFGKITYRAKELIKRMLTVDPKKRATINQVLLDPWLKDRSMQDVVHDLMRNKLGENFGPLIDLGAKYNNNKLNEIETCKTVIKRPRFK